jgi:formylglycine-generating enzyme required for sulfatase activity
MVNIAPVGTATMGAGRWGQFDLAGELWEWNLDWYRVVIFSCGRDPPYQDVCTDCAALTTPLPVPGRPPLRTAAHGGGSEPLFPTAFRMTGGGTHNNNNLIPWSTMYDDPSYRNPTNGFRCARTP